MTADSQRARDLRDLHTRFDAALTAALAYAVGEFARYRGQLRRRDEQIARLENEVSRLRERLVNAEAAQGTEAGNA